MGKAKRLRAQRVRPRTEAARAGGSNGGPRGNASTTTSVGDRREPISPPIVPGRISPMRFVPLNIARPDYATTGRPKAGRGLSLMTDPDSVARMRAACRAAAEILAELAPFARPGVATDEIDAYCHEAYIKRGGYPSTLNYHGYPKALCTSANEVICHGIPDDRVLAEGDIVNFDVTIYLDGMHGDCSATFFVGEVDDLSRRLVDTTRESLWRAIDAVRPGARMYELGRAIQQYAEQQGFSVVRAFVGHGIGERFHMDPAVPHYFDPDADLKLEPGMVFTIEPMINEGSWRHRVLADGWTALTADRLRSAQFEHTVLVTDDGVEVLTSIPGGCAERTPGGCAERA